MRQFERQPEKMVEKASWCTLPETSKSVVLWMDPWPPTKEKEFHCIISITWIKSIGSHSIVRSLPYSSPGNDSVPTARKALRTNNILNCSIAVAFIGFLKGVIVLLPNHRQNTFQRALPLLQPTNQTNKLEEESETVIADWVHQLLGYHYFVTNLSPWFIFPPLPAWHGDFETIHKSIVAFFPSPWFYFP